MQSPAQKYSPQGTKCGEGAKNGTAHARRGTEHSLNRDLQRFSLGVYVIVLPDFRYLDRADANQLAGHLLF
jgi:hypothetical protein